MVNKVKKLLLKYLASSITITLLSGFLTLIHAQVDTEFWFVVPELSHRGNTGGTPGRLRIATLELEATVTISMPANPYHPTLNPTGFQDIVIDIPANSASEVDLSHLLDNAANPNRNLLENKPLTPNGINDFGLYITSTNMINVYWEVNYDYGSDLWTLKGSNGLGTLFYTPFQTVYNNRSLTPRAYSAIDIVATQDNTQVTITLPAGKGASYGSNVTSIFPGGTHVLTLNRGETFSLYPRNYSILGADRLAGTRIESTEPIAVCVKDDALNTGSQGQPVIGDQIVPVDIIGDNYIVPDIKNPNHIYVVATEDNTNIYVTDSDGIPIGPTPYTTLNRGGQALVVVPNGSKYARITSRINPGDPVKPFYVYQLALSNQTRGGALVPAIGCTGNTQLAFTRARQGENIFYFFLITERGNEDKFLIDGVPEPTIIDPGAFTEIQGSDGWVALLTTSINANVLPIGQHLVENTGGIFHLAIINGFPGAGQGGLYYGYYSDFGGLNVGATVAGTNSSVVRACYGDSVQLHAFGGTTYQWTPDSYLDDATSNLPTAINLPPGPHDYTVEVSGSCGSGTIPLTVLVSTPVVANVETNVVSGCSPLEIQFEDKSEGTYSWQYDLGDGTPLLRYDNDPATPYQPPPDPFVFSNVYTNTTDSAINYEITLLAKNESGCSEILTKTITVYPEIHSDFTVDNDAGCEPVVVQFTNNSWGNTDTWLWEFGDGGSSVEQDPVHEYRNLFGPDNLVFDARLVAISPFQCRDTSSHTITVSPYIEASFAYDTVAECSPHEIIITDQSIGADFYTWDFGDGNTSTSTGPVISHTYVNITPFPVTYTLSLRVDNEEGCFHEIQREVTVYPGVNAAFTVNPEEACSPEEMIFQNNSIGAATYFWDFGDGGTSTETHPIHRYDRNLLRHDTVFTVTLVTTSSEFCRDTATFDVVLHPFIEAAFTVEDVVGCHPFTVNINNESVGVDNYYWNFGDGSPVSNDPSAIISHTFLNTGDSSVVYPLQLVVTNEEGCSDTMVRYITVHPEITANFSADALVGCHPLTVTFTDLSVNAVTYLWDFGDGAASVDPSPVHTFVNFGTTDTTFLVTLTTSTSDGECVKSVSWPITILWFEQAPDISGLGDTICNNTTTDIELSTTIIPRYDVRYTWTVTDPSGQISGESNSNGNGNSISQNLRQVLVNSDTDAHEVIYTITPHTVRVDSSLQCPGNPILIEIWVNPTPEIGVSASDTVICNGETSSITITNPNNTVRGNWMYDLVVTADPKIGGEMSDQSGIVTPAFNETLTNSDSIVHKVEYRFIPKIARSAGDPDCENGLDTTIIIWVNPTPEIRISSDTVICDGETTTIQVENPNNPIRGDWKYNLVVSAETEIAGEHSGGTDLTLTTISQTLTNSDTVAHYVDYQFTPLIYNDDGAVVSCPNGLDTMIRIWVNPTPEIRLNAPDTVICNGETTTLTVTNPNQTVRGDWKYDLVVTADSQISGETGSQTGIITTTFDETLTNIDTIVHKVEYQFIPRITPDDGGVDCGTNRDTTIVIWVNPTPGIRVSADTVVCSGETSTIQVRNPNNPIRGNWVYDLVVSVDSEISGYSMSQSGITTATFNETLSNSDTVVHKVEYKFTPRIVPDDLGLHCENGLDTTIIIWVNPTPRIRVAADTVICDGDDVTFNIQNPNIPIRGDWKYDLDVTAEPEIVGESIDLTDLVQTSLTETLTNTDTVVHYVDYTFIPKIYNDDGAVISCPNGIDTTIRIWVNPTPEIRISAPDTVICNGETATLTITNPNNTVRGNWEYDLVVTADPDISGATGSQSGIVTGMFDETLTNSDTIVHKVVYQFTPYITPDDGGTDCGTYLDTTIVIWVNPTPEIRVSSDTVICNGETTTIQVRNPNNPVQGDWKYNLVVTAEAEIEGEHPGGADLNLTAIPQTLTNPDTVAHYVDYQFTPLIYNGDGAVVSCPNGLDTMIRIWVNPTPEIRISAPDTVTCEGETFTISVDNPNIPVKGDWKYDLVMTADPEIVGPDLNMTGITTSSFNITLSNSDTIVHKVEYKFIPRITPDDGGIDCLMGDDTTIIIWVNPTPEIRVSAADTVICDGETSTIQVQNPNNPVRGTWLYDLVVTPDPEISGATTSQTGITTTSFNETLTHSDTVAHKVIYHFTPRIIPDDAGVECGNALDTTIVLWVNPRPRIVVSAPDSILCDDSDVSFWIRNPNLSVRGDWKYNLTVDYGAHINGWNIGGEYSDTDLGLQDHLINSDTAVHAVAYHFTPRIEPDDGGLDCQNQLDTTILIWVNPTPEIRVSVADTVICNEDDITFNIRNPNTPLRGDWKYNLTVDYGPFITGLNIGGEYDAATLNLIDNLTNNDTTYHSVSYHFTPRITPEDGGSDCVNGLDTTIVIWVNPTPAIRVIAEDSILCNGEPATIRIHNPNAFFLGDWEYDLEVTADPEIIGARGDTTGIIDTLLIDPLINTDSVVHKVEYRFIPLKTIEDSLICDGGTDTTLIIWVNPTPEIWVTTDDEIICDGDSVTLDVRNPNISVRGDWKFDLEITAEPGITGVSSGTVEYSTDTSITYVLYNSDQVARNVTYRFTPRITDDDGEECNAFKDTTIVIRVNPVPGIVVNTIDTLLCDGQYANFTVQNPNTSIQGQWLYDLEVFPDPEISGARNDTTFLLPDLSFSDQLSNTDTVVHKVIYHFIPRITPNDGQSDCENGRDTTITIWINPIPRIFPSVEDSIFCNNEIVVFTVGDGLGNVMGDKIYEVTAYYNTSDILVISRENGESDTVSVGFSISDSLVNQTNEVQSVFYTFKPRIYDNRPGHEGEYCNYPGNNITIEIQVNPTPLIYVDIDDTIFCDNSILTIELADGLGDVEGTSVYELDVTYNPVAVSGSIASDGEKSDFVDISDFLINNTDSVQIITYHLTARIRDDRPGHAGEYCDNGTDTTITVYLNPTPRIQYLLAEDTLCYDEGFVLTTNSLVQTTHPLVYDMSVSNLGLISNVNMSTDSVDVTIPWDESDILNPHDSVGTIIYDLDPYISTKGCPGTRDTFIIKVNPQPVMQVTQSDTAVCYNWGYLLPMNTQVYNTTGQLQYELTTDGYDPGMVSGVPADDFYDILPLDQMGVINNGDSIENVTYHFTPVIENARASGHCYGDPKPPIIVQVAPELKGNTVADTVVGGWNIRCFGLEDGTIHSNVSGGYYKFPYDFDWDTDGGFAGSIDEEDSVQVDLGIGKYWFNVVDTLGCFFTDTITLYQPDTIMVDTSITNATCAHTYINDGSIDITPSGGTLGYDYFWRKPYGLTETNEDIIDGVAGPYYLTLTDTNNCTFDAVYLIESARLIDITWSPSVFGDYEVTCNGDSTGSILVDDITGGFPNYDLKIYNLNDGDTIHAGIITPTGGVYTTLIEDLPAGEYRLFAFDDEQCFNFPPDTVILTEPDPISIGRINPQPYYDTVDISCFGADNGVIDIMVSGGHTARYPSNFNWTGPPGELDLVPGDSIQNSLGPGTYTVDITDFWGCNNTALFTLFEPPAIVLDVDSIRELNGWNITCNGDSDGFINVSTSGGISGYEWDWSTGEMVLSDPETEDQGDLMAGTYFLTITDSIQCTLDTSFTLLEPNKLGVTDSIPHYHFYEIACAGDSTGEIYLSPFGGADSVQNSYFWSTLDGYISDPDSMNQFGISAGTYNVFITDINGCTFDTLFILEDPDPILIDTLTADSAHCFGTATGFINLAASGGVGEFDYLWSNGETTEDLSFIYAGSYVITITDDNYCVKIDSIDVFEADHFSVDLTVTTNYNGVPISCASATDGAISIEPQGGTEPYYYSWNTGDTIQDLAGIPAGFYKVIVRDIYECTDSAEVTITEPLPIDYSMQMYDPLCYNEASGRIELLITGGTVFNLDDYRVMVNEIMASPYIDNLPQGTYHIRIEDLNDCFVETDAELVHPDSLVLSFETENAFCKDKSDGQLNLNIDGGTYPYSINWDRGLPDNEAFFNDVYWGSYVATVTDINNCVTVDSVFVDYTFTSCLVIPNAFSPNGDGFNDLWIIEGLELYPNAELRIFDRWGARVYYAEHAPDNPWEGTFDGRPLPIDSYHYIIELNNGEPPVTGNITIVR